MVIYGSWSEFSGRYHYDQLFQRHTYRIIRLLQRFSKLFWAIKRIDEVHRSESWNYFDSKISVLHICIIYTSTFNKAHLFKWRILLILLGALFLDPANKNSFFHNANYTNLSFTQNYRFQNDWPIVGLKWTNVVFDWLSTVFLYVM